MFDGNSPKFNKDNLSINSDTKTHKKETPKQRETDKQTHNEIEKRGGTKKKNNF